MIAIYASVGAFKKEGGLQWSHRAMLNTIGSWDIPIRKHGKTIFYLFFFLFFIAGLICPFP